MTDPTSPPASSDDKTPDGFNAAGPDVIAPGEGELIVNLEGFEGPLDLLLSLARDQKVDLTKLSILDLADQYLAFVARARRLRLELAADYLVMAAWLAYLKSRLVLPQEKAPGGEASASWNHACRLEVWLGTMSTMSRRPASCRAVARVSNSASVPMRGSTSR